MKIKLEELYKDKWVDSGNLVNNCLILAKLYDRIIYDVTTEEVITRYSVLPNLQGEKQ